MTVLDANILFYAYDAKAPPQPRVAAWLETLLNSGEAIGLPWITIWAFIRLSTNSRILVEPFDPKQAFSIVRYWISQSGVITLDPGPRHATILEQFVVETGAKGSLVTDATLAALAIENGATLASADHAFRRFPGLRWVNPLA